MPGTVVLTSHKPPSPSVGVITIDATADAAAATFPNLVIPAFEGHLVSILTNPGSTAPTDNYDIVLNDAEAIDRLQGVGANRDTATSESAAVFYSGTSQHPPVAISDVLTLGISGNAVNSATIRIILVYALGA